MDINLVIYDIDHFINKYTRFMTKNIYISNKMYNRFLKQYDYLYQTLSKERFLYNDNKKYQKVMNILEKKQELIKLHNQKYYKESLKTYQEFFNNIDKDNKLDIRKKTIILCEEEKLFIIESKNPIPLITGKINFLTKYKNYKQAQFLILTDTDKKANLIKEITLKEGFNLNVKSMNHYEESLLKKEEKLINSNKQYEIIINYIINKLFLNKKEFNTFYESFSKYIYLNKDYKDYETFKDYHNYMYKRKYLSSKLTLKKFNEQEIKRRKTYLKTINNEVMKQKEEVDIANFLYINSIPYQYDYENSLFKITLDEKYNEIKYINEEEKLSINKNTYIDSTIYLYKSYNEKKTFLEVLVYELIKRRYPIELMNDELIYNKLKNTSIDSYFNEFISKYLIPMINYYEETKTLENTRLDINQQEEFKKIYTKYNNYLTNCHYIKNNSLLKRIELEINSSNYKYLILVGNISLNCHINTLNIVEDYQYNELLKENIKLLYDYKKYIYNNQSIGINNVYLDKLELNNLTSNFLKENLNIINKNLEETKKYIEIYEYDDNSRLHIYSNIRKIVSNILKEEKNTLIAFKQLKDTNILIGDNLFSKIDKNTLLTNTKNKIKIEEILNINKLSDSIILPYLILDNYHEDFLKNDYQYHIKTMIYITLNKCRKKLIILVPKSRKKELKAILKTIKKQIIYK